MKNCNNCDFIHSLFQTKNGRVSFCSKSLKYEVELCSMLVYYDKTEFEYFCSFVKLLDLSDESKYAHLASGKIIIQPALNSGFYALYLKELKELKNLINGALSMINIEKDIDQLFHKPNKKGPSKS